MRNVRKIIGCILFIIVIVCGIFLTINNPDMTETRLFITYWKEYIILTIIGVVGYLLANS